MRIDVILAPGTDAGTAKSVALLAEKYALNRLWASNFPGQPDPFMVLMPAALATQRVGLGVMPYSPYEKHPVKIADSLLTLHAASQGRAAILVGGMGKSVMRATGLMPRRRVTAVRECVAILRGCASRAPFRYQGELFQAEHYFSPWAPSRAPDLYVAANGPQMLQLAGECGDAVMLSDVTETHFHEVLSRIDIGLTKVHRSRARLPISNFFAWHIKADRAAAIAEARMELVWRGALLRWHIAPYLDEADIGFVERHWERFFQAFVQRTPVIEGVPERIVDRLIGGLTFTGDSSAIDSVAARLSGLEALGQTEVALRLFDEPEQAVRLIGERLLPALRAVASRPVQE